MSISDSGNSYRNYENMNLDSGGTLPFLYRVAKRLGSVDADTGESLERPRWHEEIEIKHFLSGRAEIICGPRVFIAGAGDTVIINSCELHGIRALGDEPPVYHLLMIPPKLPCIDELCQKASIRLESPRFHNLIHGDEEIGEIFGRLFAELDRKEPAYELCAVGYLEVLFGCLLRGCTEDEPRASDAEKMRKYAERLRPALEYIHTNYAGDIRIEKLAAICSLSRFHFCRLFKQVTGYTVSGYTMKFRINKAELLLRNTELSVADIAASVGYPDECYFCRCFKRQVGTTPSSIREAK